MDVVGLAIALVALVVALAALQRAKRVARRPDTGASGPSRHGGSGRPVAETEDPIEPPAWLNARSAKAPPAEGVHFELRSLGDSQYRLRNFGTDPAYAVKFRAHRLGKNASYDEFPAGSSDEFELVPKQDAERNVVEITWHERRNHSDQIHHKLLRVPPR
ncbi:hypothetical protein [Phytoactinopolyspora endophytica]|uniref:hypothetical protein n=1 Tax=Phytoactinopolyspora endophytica TaxID=1642495 RepID=UPI00101CDAD1|nr:hypothetical protein [Phytoactinopolyspora endophytica]